MDAPAAGNRARIDDPPPPRVAVVVPCYDDGATVRETVDSVRGQECELVVVDDGSTDPATLEELDRLRAEGVRVIRVENGGVARARTAGVEATSAPYVFPLDADDRAAEGALAALADALDADPAIGVAWGYVESFGAARRLTRQASSLDPWLLTYVNGLPSASLIRREALLEAGGWADGIGYEDWDLWLSLAERGWRGTRIPRVTLHYRVSHGGRRWRSAMARHDDVLALLRARHERLFAARPENRRRSSAPRRLKLLLPLVDRLPISGYDKLRLAFYLRRPLSAARAAVARRRASAGR